MSDTQTIEVSAIPNDATVTIKVSGSYFSRLQMLYFHTANLTFPTPEALGKAMAGLLEKTKFSESENDEYNVQTLMILLHTLENEFEKAGVVTKQKVPFVPNAD